MHKEIRIFPSIHFYENLLEDGFKIPDNIFRNVDKRLLFIDIIQSEEIKDSDETSYYNINEISSIIEILKILKI